MKAKAKPRLPKGRRQRSLPGRRASPLIGGMRYHPLTQVNAFPEILGRLVWRNSLSFHP